MRERRASVSHNCIFVLPASDSVELLLNYKGLEWSNENINEDRLRNFARNCEGFNISFFENANGKILMFSQSGKSEDSIDIYFEGIFMDSLPCAFFDKDSKSYDNFSLPSSTIAMTVSVGSNAKLIVEWEYQDEDRPEEKDGDSFEEEVDLEDDFEQEFEAKPASVNAPSKDEADPHAINDRLTATCQELSSENESLQARIESCQAEISSLQAKIKDLEDQHVADLGNDEKDREINELNRLIRQLADDRFSGTYVETLDDEINSLTEAITKQRELLDEKQRSKNKLEADLQKIEDAVAEAKEAISRLMLQIDKAESIQNERSAELSEKQERINVLLADLEMDEETLEMYSVDDTIETVLAEATEIKKRLEEKLKALILERQRDCDERSNRLKGES